MTNEIENPPAFPVFPDTQTGHGAAFRGMSLRDYFAAKALGALVSTPGNPSIKICADYIGIETKDWDWSKHWCEYLAKKAYAYADAMLEERGK